MEGVDCHDPSRQAFAEGDIEPGAIRIEGEGTPLVSGHRIILASSAPARAGRPGRRSHHRVRVRGPFGSGVFVETRSVKGGAVDDHRPGRKHAAAADIDCKDFPMSPACAARDVEDLSGRIDDRRAHHADIDAVELAGWRGQLCPPQDRASRNIAGSKRAHRVDHPVAAGPKDDGKCLPRAGTGGHVHAIHIDRRGVKARRLAIEVIEGRRFPDQPKRGRRDIGGRQNRLVRVPPRALGIAVEHRPVGSVSLGPSRGGECRRASTVAAGTTRIMAAHPRFRGWPTSTKSRGRRPRCRCSWRCEPCPAGS